MKTQNNKRLVVVYLAVMFLSSFLSSCGKHYIYKLKSHSYSYPSDITADSKIGISVKHLAASKKQWSGYYLLADGMQALSSIMQLSDNAKYSIDLQYYLYHADMTGQLLADALLRAANRGVRVRILLDDMFSRLSTPLMVALNAHKNIEVRFFHTVSLSKWLKPIVLFTDFRRINKRMHNKAFIVDNQVALIGGRNIGDAYFMAKKQFLFTDVDVLTIGPVVSQASHSFDLYWNSDWAIPLEIFYEKSKRVEYRVNLAKTRQELNKHRIKLYKTAYGQTLAQSTIGYDLINKNLPFLWAKSQLIADPPDKIISLKRKDPRFIQSKMLPYLQQAKQSVLLISPYFIPQKKGLKWIKKLRKRGVEVSILTNSFASNDVAITHSGYQRYRLKLLKMGVNIYEFKPSAFRKKRLMAAWFSKIPRASLHAKTVVVDGKYVMVGSANLSPRSRYLNTEVMILIESRAFAKRTIALFNLLSNPKNSFRVMLLDKKIRFQNNSNLIWHTYNSNIGKYVQYSREPGTWILPHLGITVLSLLPLEELF